jgi:hypothetical protein
VSDEEPTVSEHTPSAQSARNFELFHLEGPAALMTPSAALAALSAGLGVASEEVGAVVPLGAGHLSLELEERRAARLSTPRDLPVRVGSARALLHLSRSTDEPTFPSDRPQPLEVVVRVTGSMPGPSALIAALCEALQIAAEDVGFALEGHDFARLSLPLAAARRLREPLEVTVGDTRCAIEVASKKP